MTSIKKVSIIIPTYNRSSFLKETIFSVLSQSYTNIELVVSDNNSTDDTEEVVRSFNDPRILYFKSLQNMGAVRNHYQALSLTTGEYVHIFSDDDRMFNVDCISKKVAILEKYPEVGLVHSDINVIDANGKITSNEHYVFKRLKKWGKLHSKNQLFCKEDYHKYLLVNNLICMPAVMIRRQVIEKVGNFDINITYLGDWQYWLKTTLYFDVYYLNEKLVSYRIHQSNNVKLLSLKTLTKEYDYIWSDLKMNHSNSLIVKSKVKLLFLKMYYNYNHRFFYLYPFRYLVSLIKN